MQSETQRYYAREFLKALIWGLVSLPIVLPRDAYRKHRWRLEEPGCIIESNDKAHLEEYHYHDEQYSLQVYVGKLHCPLVTLHSFVEPSTGAFLSYDKVPHAVARMLKYLARVEGHKTIRLEIDQANPPTDRLLAEIDSKLEPKRIHRQSNSKVIMASRFNWEKRAEGYIEQIEMSVLEWHA